MATPKVSDQEPYVSSSSYGKGARLTLCKALRVAAMQCHGDILKANHARIHWPRKPFLFGDVRSRVVQVKTEQTTLYIDLTLMQFSPW